MFLGEADHGATHRSKPCMACHLWKSFLFFLWLCRTHVTAAGTPPFLLQRPNRISFHIEGLLWRERTAETTWKTKHFERFICKLDKLEPQIICFVCPSFILSRLVGQQPVCLCASCCSHVLVTWTFLSLFPVPPINKRLFDYWRRLSSLLLMPAPPARYSAVKHAPVSLLWTNNYTHSACFVIHRLVSASFSHRSAGLVQLIPVTCGCRMLQLTCTECVSAVIGALAQGRFPNRHNNVRLVFLSVIHSRPLSVIWRDSPTPVLWSVKCVFWKQVGKKSHENRDGLENHWAWMYNRLFFFREM